MLQLSKVYIFIPKVSPHNKETIYFSQVFMKIYVGGISPEIIEKDLMGLYSQFGTVAKVDLLKEITTGQNRGYAFVHFNDEMEGEAAILGTNNTLFGGNNIQVSMSRSRLDQKRAKQSGPKSFKPRTPNQGFKPRENREQSTKPFRQNTAASGEGIAPRTNSPRHFNKPFSSNTNRGPRRYGDQQNQNQTQNAPEGEDRYNTKVFPKKGADYGRGNAKPFSTQMSFLGNENFGVPTTSDQNMYTGNDQNYNRKPRD